MVRERIAHLNHAAANWQLYEVDGKTSTVQAVDTGDIGNISTRLVIALIMLPRYSGSQDRSSGLVKSCRKPKCTCSRPQKFRSGYLGWNLRGHAWRSPPVRFVRVKK